MWRTLCLLACLGMAACSSETNPATQIVVSIDSDLVVGTELGRVEAEVAKEDGTRTGAKHTFKLSGTSALPVSFGVQKQTANRFLLIVKGFSPAGAEVIEQRVIAEFAADKSVLLQVFLGRGCFNKGCPGEQTCTGEGQCAAPRVARNLPTVEPGAEPGGDDPGPSSNNGGDDGDGGANGGANAPSTNGGDNAGGNAGNTTGGGNAGGNDPNGGANTGGGVSRFIGTWKVMEGSETVMCNGETRDRPLPDTSGQIIAAGTSSDLVFTLNDGCDLPADVSGDHAYVTDQSCVFVSDATETDTYYFSEIALQLDADGVTAYEEWTADVEVLIGGQTGYCTSTASITLQKVN